MSCVAGALDGDGVIDAQREALEMIQNASYLAAWFDNACDPSVYVVYGQGGQAIATGDATPESVMEQVRTAAASLH